MQQRHRKGSLSAKHEAKRGRGANPMAALPLRGPNEKELLAHDIRALVKIRKLTAAQAAHLAGEPATRMSLLLSDKLFSFTMRQLVKMRDRLSD
jgi:hypothetical protein